MTRLAGIAQATLFLGLLPYLLRAPQINIVIDPNPNKQAGKIRGYGIWSLDPGTSYTSVKFEVTLKNSNPLQSTYTDKAGSAQGTWDATLGVIAGTYNPCTATLHWIDKNMQAQKTNVTNTFNNVVQ